MAIKKVILQPDGSSLIIQAKIAERALHDGPDEHMCRLYEHGGMLYAVKFNRSSITVWPQPKDERS